MSKKPLTSNSADPDAVACAGEKEVMQEESQTADMRAVLDTPEGRRVMKNLIGFTGVFRTTFTGNSETFYREGARQVGLKIIADVRLSAPERLAELID